jgi:ribonuclease PH
MDSQSDPKTRKSPDAEKKVRIIEDELGHQVFQGTIKTVKLTLMNTGVTFMSEEQQRLMKLAEAGIDDARNDVDEDLEISDDSTGFDPYNSIKK